LFLQSKLKTTVAAKSLTNANATNAKAGSEKLWMLTIKGSDYCSGGLDPDRPEEPAQHGSPAGRETDRFNLLIYVDIIFIDHLSGGTGGGQKVEYNTRYTRPHILHIHLTLFSHRKNSISTIWLLELNIFIFRNLKKKCPAISGVVTSTERRHGGGPEGLEGPRGDRRREKVTKYGLICRGGSEENELQLVDVHTRGSREEAAAGRKRGGGEGGRRQSEWGHGVSFFVCFRHHGYRVHWHSRGETGRSNRRKEKTLRGDTDPPLLVLLSVHHDDLALREGQLVRVVGDTVVDGFHSLRPLLLQVGTRAHRRVGSGWSSRAEVWWRRPHGALCLRVSGFFVCLIVLECFFRISVRN